MRQWITATAVAAVVTCVGLPHQAQAQDEIDDAGFVDENADGVHDGFHGRRHHRHLAHLAAQLTEEQIAELRATIEELKESDATREEMKTAVDAVLESFGVDVPDVGDHLAARFGDALTDEQIQAIVDKVNTLREAGATRDVVQGAVHDLLEGYGVDLPDVTDHLTARFGEMLTEEQLAQLVEEVTALEDAGATRDEIRAAVDASLEDYGIDVPAGPGRGSKGPGGRDGGFHGRRGNRGHFRPVGPVPDLEPVADPE